MHASYNQGTKYCKRKPRKIPKTSSSSSSTSTCTSSTPRVTASKPPSPSPSSSSLSSSSRTTGGGAFAAACAASGSSGGSSAAAAAPRSSLPPFGGGGGAGGGTGKRGMIQALQSESKLAASFSKKMKREGGAAAGRVRRTPPPPPPPLGGGGGGVTSARPGGMALPGGGTLLPPQHETRVIEDERPSPSAVGGGVASSGYDGSDRSGLSGTDASSGDDPCLGSSTVTIDGFGSHRSSLGDGFGFNGGDRRFGLDVAAADPTSNGGSGLPFYFAPLESGGGGGGRERAVAVDGPGGGNAEAEQVAAVSMMAARTSLEEALYGACYRRASFEGLAPAAVAAPSTLAHSHHQYQPLQYQHPSSSEGLAWNQLLQQADATGQWGVHTAAAAAAAEGTDQPTGDSRVLSTSLHLSGGFGGGGEARAAPARQQQRQQSFFAMPHDHDRFALDGGVGLGALTTLKDLLFDNNRWSHQPPPSLNELPMMESTS
ncbi:unnamed protein product [Ectocarpus sp. CCAP 1310/34]|nr:unnamed protein product [Ectocarpus sp. CCAP 1310/34]